MMLTIVMTMVVSDKMTVNTIKINEVCKKYDLMMTMLVIDVDDDNDVSSVVIIPEDDVDDGDVREVVGDSFNDSDRDDSGSTSSCFVSNGNAPRNGRNFCKDDGERIFATDSALSGEEAGDDPIFGVVGAGGGAVPDNTTILHSISG